MQYISISLYRKMISCALNEGMSKDDFDWLPVPISAMDTVQAVPADVFFSLHERLDEELGPGFSVRVGLQMKIEDYGVLGLSWRTCSKAGEIFERSERYFKMLSNTYVFKVEEKAPLSKVYLLRDPYRRGVELSNEATFSATVVVLRAMTETNITPVEIGFMHTPPNDLSSYDKAFGCPVLFDQPHYYMTYKTADLSIRTAKADASINQFLVERVEEETQGIEVSPIKIAADVALLIKEALPSGIPSIVQIGEYMGMSSRTLTRRLSESGVSYRELVRQTQEKAARELLQSTADSISEIAFQTGFSEQSAFSRAFKRWTGHSPIA
ncbi:MAG TPA: AraC family transcriptional regulator ligand-binding domain-containing protein [Phaeodactylibacter sp.]|nr:AraC family transcriptional regulator ligand-binding domain-containing protein [Phaeodactylibacter sp.]